MVSWLWPWLCAPVWDDGAAGRVEADRGCFPQADAGAQRADHRRGGDAACLDVGGQADAAAAPARLRFRPAAREAGVVGERERRLQGLGVVARIVFEGDLGGVGEGVGRDQVAAPELGRVDAHLAGGDIDDALHHEGRFRAPGAAHRVDRRGVGVDRLDLAVDVLGGVLALQQGAVEVGRHRRGEGREVGAHVGDGLDPEAEELAVLVECELGMGGVVAPMGVGDEGLGAVGGPFDGTPDPLRGPDDYGFLGVDEDLRAEAAADVGRDHAQLVLGRDGHEGRQHQARHMRILAGVVEGVAVAGGVVLADRRARLDGVGDDAVVDEVEPGDVAGRGEGGVGRRPVADLPVVAGVAGHVVVHLHRALPVGAFDVDLRRQHLVVDDHGLGAVARLLLGLGDDDGDRVTDMANPLLGQRRMGRHLHVRAVLGGDVPAADEVADLVAGEVGAGQHGDDAGGGEGGGGVDRADGGVGMRRAHEMGRGLPAPREIVHVAAAAGEEAEILLAPHAGADALVAVVRHGLISSKAPIPWRRPAAPQA